MTEANFSFNNCSRTHSQSCSPRRTKQVSRGQIPFTLGVCEDETTSRSYAHTHRVTRGDQKCISSDWDGWVAGNNSLHLHQDAWPVYHLGKKELLAQQQLVGGQTGKKGAIWEGAKTWGKALLQLWVHLKTDVGCHVFLGDVRTCA